MTRSDLIGRVAALHSYMNSKNAAVVVSIVIDGMVEALQNGRRVEFRGFGSFGVKRRSCTEERNPKTGEKISAKAKNVPFFRAGKPLRDFVNGRLDNASASFQSENQLADSSGNY
jgi:integration host factor subunit beta